MGPSPPEELLELLGRLRLANAADVVRMRPRVRRLARDLPLFQSVWVDALAQTRILTPFQAGQINAGHGERLRVGPYVLCRPIGVPTYAAIYLARETDSNRTVRLAVVEPPEAQADELLGRLEALAAHAGRLSSDCLMPIGRAGKDGSRLWASSRHVDAWTAADWMVHHGRFPPEAVLEIARQMLPGLIVLERAGLCHGDLSPANVLLTSRGQVLLAQPGLRGVLRPAEGYAHVDLMPECYDYLAPERILRGTPPTVASDLYACGALWWHLLTGRPPVSGGDSLGKLRAVARASIVPVRRLAPETPAALAEVISQCLRRDPAQRPRSMADVQAVLAGPTKTGRFLLAHTVRRPGWPRRRLSLALRASWDAPQAPLWLALGAAGLVGLLSLLWFAGQRPRAAGIASPDEEHQEVRPASFVEDGSPRDAEASPGDLVLGAGARLMAESLALRDGQCVRGPRGQRPLVIVPAGGWTVVWDDVRFEHIDFVFQPSQDAAKQPEATAIVRLEASRAEFRECSFQAAVPVPRPRAAIVWGHSRLESPSEAALPSGRVVISDCVFRHVGAAVYSQRSGAVGVEMSNTLHLGSGPLLALDRCPKPDEPVAVSLSAVTLRGSGPLLECRFERMEDPPGSVAIRTHGCVLAIAASAGLLSFVGPTPPDRLLAAIQWTGEGSLVPPDTIITQWRRNDGSLQTFDESSLSIAGVVRSVAGFAGPADGRPDAHRLLRWQAPLRSADPPGIDPHALDWPR